MACMRAILSLIALAHAFGYAPVLAQATDGEAHSPEEVAEAYLEMVEAMRWEGVVSRVHPEALASFRSHLDAVLLGPPGYDGQEADPAALRALAGVSTLQEYRETSDDRLLLRTFRSLEEEAPGILNAWVDRTTELLGVVAEADSLAHAVYRLQWGLSGSTPDTQVLTLARAPDGGWRVLRSRELDSIRPALVAVLRRIGS